MMRALVVDDEEELRSIIVDELKDLSWEATEAHDVASALLKIGTEDISAVVSDIRMPMQSGIDFLQTIRAQYGTKHVFVLISGFADIEIWDAFEMGADGYFSKPFHLNELTDFLSRMSQSTAARWSELPAQDLVEKAVPFKFAGQTSLGRGGLFVPGLLNTSFARGQVLELQIEDGASRIEGYAICRWIRRQSQGELKPGCGLEFIYLKDDCREQLVKRLETQTPLAFIPKT